MRAIQSAHFGAFNNQISMHTGVPYTPDKTLSFCSVSDCTRHDPASIWAHLSHHPIPQRGDPGHHVHKVLEWRAHNTVPQQAELCSSDSHSRSGSGGLYLDCLEAGHGKGAADVIGGVLKWTADQAVNAGSTTDNAESFVDVMGNRTKVPLFLVT